MIKELLLGWKELEAALPAYLEAEEYAKGDVDEIFASEAIKRTLIQTGEAYKFNLIKTAIDRRADRCVIDMIKIPNDEAATNRLTEVWKANEMAIYYPGLIHDTFTFGDAYLMVWPLPQEVGDNLETVDDDLIAIGVEFTTHNPKNMRVIYDPENARRKWFAIHRWCVKSALGLKEIWRVDLLFADYVEHWISTPSATLTEEDGWMPFNDPDAPGDETGVEENPFGEVPVFHHRTGIPYGSPVHLHGYGAQNAINKQLITLLTTTDSQGFPQRYGLLNKDAVLDQNNDDPQWVDDDDAGLVSPAGEGLKGAQPTGMRSGPGTFQVHTGMDSVGEFAAADPKVFTDPTELFIRILAQVTNTPFHYFDPSGDVPSGESLKVADAPLVKDIEWLQTLQTGPLREEWIFALGVLGMKVKDVDVQWAPVESATGLDDWQIVKAKQEAGVPVDQTLTEAGYRPEQVATWLDADAEANTLADRVSLLSEIGSAIQAMSAGIESGVVDQAQASAAIGLVLAQVQQSGEGVPPA